MVQVAVQRPLSARANPAHGSFPECGPVWLELAPASPASHNANLHPHRPRIPPPSVLPPLSLSMLPWLAGPPVPVPDAWVKWGCHASPVVARHPSLLTSLRTVISSSRVRVHFYYLPRRVRWCAPTRIARRVPTRAPLSLRRSLRQSTDRKTRVRPSLCPPASSSVPIRGALAATRCAAAALSCLACPTLSCPALMVLFYPAMLCPDLVSRCF